MNNQGSQGLPPLAVMSLNRFSVKEVACGVKNKEEGKGVFSGQLEEGFQKNKGPISGKDRANNRNRSIAYRIKILTNAAMSGS